jgi:hypothetical protein
VKLYKEMELDLDAERKRIDRVKYTKREKKMLHSIVDMVQRGDLAGAVKVTETWTREQREFIAPEIFQILWETALGARFLTFANHMIPSDE